jgi:hypothetical protein
LDTLSFSGSLFGKHLFHQPLQSISKTMILQREQENEEGSSSEFLNHMSPQKSQLELASSPQFSFSSPTPKKGRARPRLPPKSQKSQLELVSSRQFSFSSPTPSKKERARPRLQPKSQKSQLELVSSRQFSFSSPTPRKERASPLLPPKSAGGERKSPFKAAMKLLVSPVKKVKKASVMLLSGSFHNLNFSPTVGSFDDETYEDEDDEEENDDADETEVEKKNTDFTMMLLCRELELLSD